MKKTLPKKELKYAKKAKMKKKGSATDTFAGSGTIYWIAGLILLAFFCFIPALTNNLVNWDDYNYIRDNPYIQNLSPGAIASIFNVNTFIMGNYHPLTILSYAFEYKIAGANPFLYHFDNILIHLFNIFLVSLLAWLLTKKKYAVIIITALFAVHPMRVESVVWAAERKDVLYTFFYLLALLSYIYYVTVSENRTRSYILAFVFFLFSILSKGQAVVLPLTFLLIDYWYDKKIEIKMLLNKIPFFVLSLIFGGIAIRAQSSSLTEERLISHSFMERIIYAAYNLSAYLYKLVYPYDLACYYGYPMKSAMAPVYLGAVLAIVILVLLFLFFRKNKVVVFGTLFFLFTIFIVIQLMPIGNAIIADRYTYIPYIGLFFIIGILLDTLVSQKPKLRTVVTGILFVQIGIFGFASFMQAGTWKNNITLWNRVISNNPKEPVAYNNIAIDYMDTKNYDKAKASLFLAIKNSETYPEVYRSYHNLGKAFSETGKPETGLLYYDTSIMIANTYLDAYFGRGLTYTDMGKYDKAIADFSFIINHLNPNDVQSYYSRAVAYNKKGLSDSALTDYSRAVQIQPDYAKAYTNRGNIFFNQGKFQDAIFNYNEAVRYDSSSGINFMNRSFAYFRNGDYQPALTDALRAQGMKVNVPEQYITDLKKALGK